MKPDAVKHFPNLAERIHRPNIVSLAIKELCGQVVDFFLLLLIVSRVIDTTSVLKRVSHCELLLQVADFFLIALNL